jgi:large subunit ribosomal protein L4
MLNICVFLLDWNKSLCTKLSKIDLNNNCNIDNKHNVVYEVAQWQRSLHRKTIAAALNKGNVKGSGKKPFAQKGRGMARQGSFKNPHQRGGGVAFLPQNRIYSYKINRKKRQLALKVILLHKINNNNIKIFQHLHMEKHSTKMINNFLKKNNYKKILVIDVNNKYLSNSMKNIKYAKFLNFKGLNTLDFLKYQNIIMTKNIINKINCQHNILQCAKEC